MRLPADEMTRRRVGGHGGDGDDEVAERVVGLQAPARPHAEEALHAELGELLEHDGRARAAHAGALNGDRLPVPLPREPEQPALLVDLGDVRQECLGDVLGAEWVARQEARLRIVAGLGAKMDRHARNPTSFLRPVVLSRL